MFIILLNIDLGRGVTAMREHGRIRAALLCVCVVVVLCLTPVRAMAKPLTGESLYFLTAAMSAASYSGEWQEILREKLKRAGWDIASFATRTEKTYGRTFLYSKETTNGERIYLLAFPGTECREDVRVDLRFARVPFGGDTPAESAVQAGSGDDGDNVPRVHKGFNDYVQAALFTNPLTEGEHAGITLGEAIAEQLKKDPEGHLYVTGHSLGGAAAVLAAARLADMGVHPDQLTVVTFGTPAVGDKAFAEAYVDRFRLERIEMRGDIMKALLQSPLGYHRFGHKVEWKESKGNERFRHDMVLYLDAAIRRYYDSEHEQDIPALLMREEKRRERIYLAPIKPELDENISEDEIYMQKLLRDYIETEYDVIDLPETDSAAKLTLPTLYIGVTAERIRNERHSFRLTVERMFLAGDGSMISVSSRSDASADLTPMETVLYLLGQAER
ncbi:hypothetical protein TAMA11512_07310 [Selenomonas sp. TAMA-11512]|uniref:lipase family protein n=1 Tax=Selenomonas sp. TAMA-11512 TaxID=3095337 RepID=UPI0030893BFC|nr:hypothetical protein TAMA11512_07310 [Selenomonas sp. TAMA-11512]